MNYDSIRMPEFLYSALFIYYIISLALMIYNFLTPVMKKIQLYW